MAHDHEPSKLSADDALNGIYHYQPSVHVFVLPAFDAPIAKKCTYRKNSRPDTVERKF